MVHVGPLPSAPHYRGESVQSMVEQALAEARILRDAGFDALIVENMHDRPYVNGPHDPAVTSAMTRIVGEVVEEVGKQMVVGVQVLSRGELEALAIAHATGARFIRVENYVFAHVADEGLLQHASAGPLLRARRGIGAAEGASGIAVFADVQKKHASHAITGDLGLADLVHGAHFFSADGVIVTGMVTGQPADMSDVATARKHAHGMTVLVGSGVTPEQVKPLFEYADALIIGSWIKQGGVWDRPVDAERCKKMVTSRKP